MKVYINFWKRLLFSGAIRGEVEVGTSGPRGERLEARRLRTGFLQQAEGIVERRVEQRAKTKKKKENLPYLPNRLAEPLSESF